LQQGKVTALCAILLAGLVILAACQPVFEVQISLETEAAEPVLGKVAYIMGGDLWVYDLDNAQAQRLTFEGYASHPRWSPDGSQIAYRKQNQLWVVNLASQQHDLVREFWVDWFTWSASSDQMLYFSQEEGLILWDSATKTPALVLPDVSGIALNDFVYDDQSGVLLFTKGQVEQGVSAVALVQFDLAQMESSNVYKSVDLKLVPLMAELSPGGQWASFWQWDTRVMFYEEEGLPLCYLPVSGGEVQCTTAMAVPSLGFLDWSSDGQLVYLTVDGDLIMADPLKGSEELLVELKDRLPINPTWAPEGGRIAISVMDQDAGDAEEGRDLSESIIPRRIGVVDLASQKLNLLTGDAEFGDELPQWSSDGKYILFARQNEERMSLWLMRANGKDQVEIVPELTPKPRPVGQQGDVSRSKWWDWWRPEL
jgi:hypothetical protein